MVEIASELQKRVQEVSGSPFATTAEQKIEKAMAVPPEKYPPDTLPTNLSASSTAASTMEDARDEDEEDMYRSPEDPYTYSDDSASLSDAYFFPQSDDEAGRPPRYRKDDIDSITSSALFPFASYYGAVSNGALQPRSQSPLWEVAGAIQEDAESIPSDQNEVASLLPVRGKNHHRRQKRKHRRFNREHAVYAIRGRTQDRTVKRDRLWAILFLVQLLMITFYAVHFGYRLWFAGIQHVWRGPWSNGNQVLQYNGTTNDIQYSDDIIHHQSQEVTAVHHHHNSLAPNATATRTSSLSSSSENFEFTIDYENVIALVSIAGMYSCVLIYLSFGFMLVLARSLIYILLAFSVLLALAWGLIGLTLDPYGALSIMGFGALLLTLGYTIFNWNNIPFAATNLHTALCAMRCTADITILGLVSLLTGLAWCLVWSMSFIGIVNYLHNEECSANNECHTHVTGRHLPLYLVLFLSFHWTTTTIKNVARVTVASAVGTWWFFPSDVGPICTPAVTVPLRHSLTNSFGSICLGSLVLQPAQLLTSIGKVFCCVCGNPESNCMNAKMDPRGSSRKKSNVLLGIPTEESESAIDSVGICSRICNTVDQVVLRLRSYNRWSYTYIGMYSYGFAEAGEKALQLFETREWMEVVNDGLIQNSLLMASVIVGGSTGIFAVVAEEMDGFEFSSFHQPIISAFMIGSVLGYVLSNILLLGVVGSAVNTVLVCYAAGPFDFDRNHPILSREMRDVWSQQVWEPQHN